MTTFVSCPLNWRILSLTIAGAGRIRDGGVRGETETQAPETQGVAGESGERFGLPRFPGRPREAGLREQRGRVAQQADKKAGEEADPIRDRGGVGEEDRLDVPALQNDDLGKRKVGCRREIVTYHEAK